MSYNYKFKVFQKFKFKGWTFAKKIKEFVEFSIIISRHNGKTLQIVSLAKFQTWRSQKKKLKLGSRFKKKTKY